MRGRRCARATRLAAALAEVGHHRVHGVADEHGRVVGPRPKELGPPVVEVALLDGGGGRRVEHIPDEVGRRRRSANEPSGVLPASASELCRHCRFEASAVSALDLLCPSLVLLPEIVDHRRALRVRRRAALPRVARALRPRRLAQEGVPLHAAVADVGRHEVLPRADVHLNGWRRWCAVGGEAVLAGGGGVKFAERGIAPCSRSRSSRQSPSRRPRAQTRRRRRCTPSTGSPAA